VKRVYFAAGETFHLLWRELIQYPPDGYEFIVNKKMERKEKLPAGRKLSRSVSYAHVLPYIAYFWWWYKWYSRASYEKRPSDVDLTYSAHSLILRNEPWVVSLEHVGDLCPVRYDIRHLRLYRSLIEKVLSSKYCKKIMPWLDNGKKTLLLNLNCERFKGKIETVHLAVHPKKFVKKRKKDKVRLLFIGTANISNVPDTFVVRGGKEVLEAFAILNKKYDDLELIVRSYIPPDIRSRYSEILKSKNVRIIDEILPWKQFEQLFTSSDMLLFPGHLTPALTILDAMSYEFPVIATDVWGTPEMVQDGKTGFLIEKSRNVPYYVKNFIPSYGYISRRAFEYVDPRVVRELADKTSILIENETLRHRMGLAGRREIETGKFSIKRRNEKLKKIFDEAIKNG